MDSSRARVRGDMVFSKSPQASPVTVSPSSILPSVAGPPRSLPGQPSFVTPSGVGPFGSVSVTDGPRGTGYASGSLPPSVTPNGPPGILQPGASIAPSPTSMPGRPGDMVVFSQPGFFPRDPSVYANSAQNAASAAYAAASSASSNAITPNSSQNGMSGVSHNSHSSWSGPHGRPGIAWAALLFLVIAVVGVTITIAVVASKQSPDVSSHMIVRTGQRTRDWSAGNSYSMHTLDDNHHMRLYVCMKTAGIAVPNDPNINTFGEYKTAAKRYHDCGPKSDRGWPRDIGFLRYIQQHFHVNFHQSNVFLKCLDLSEGASAESIQTPASMLFMGSYNFVTMLLTSMGIIAAFLIFTAGGYFTSDDVFEIHGHISATHYWSPLSWIPTISALLWSFSMWVTVMIYAFPPSNMWSDAPSDSSSSLPGTPWTGFMCSVVVFVLFVFFVSCLGEWMDDFAMKRDGSYKKSDPLIPDSDGTVNVMSGPGSAIPSAMPTIMPSIMPTGMPTAVTTGMPSGMSTTMPGSASASGPLNGGQTVYASAPGPPYSNRVGTVGFAGRYPRASSFQNLIRRSGYSRIPTQLGTKYNPDLHCSGSDVTRIASPLNKTFALTWVFVDGLLFVGMLNNQNSLLNENVVSIWYYIIMCRGYQLTASFFMDDVLFINVDQSNGSTSSQSSHAGNPGTASSKNGSGGAKNNSEIKAHACIAVACSHFASLWCMIIVSYHFANAVSVASNLNYIGVSNPTYLLQIFFIVFILLMDVFKHIVAFATIFDQISQDWYLPIIEGTFSVDWAVRSIFIIAAIFSVPSALSEANQSLRNTILMPTG